MQATHCTDSACLKSRRAGRRLVCATAQPSPHVSHCPPHSLSLYARPHKSPFFPNLFSSSCSSSFSFSPKMLPTQLILAAALLLTTGLASPAPAELLSNIEKRCNGNGSFCNNGVPCCAGTYCSTSQICRSCNGNGSFCNNGVPCCAGTFCSTSQICRSCNGNGSFCNNGVPCCAGTYCSSSQICRSCNGNGSFCNNGVPCCAGTYCSSSQICRGCNGSGSFCNNGVPCCAGLTCSSSQICRY